MSSTRIKAITRHDGRIHYYPQYKILFWWECFSIYGDAYRRAIVHFACPYNSEKAKSLEFAQKVIDKHLEILENDRKRKENSKVKHVDYIKYP